MKKRGRGGDDETGKLASECKTACIKKSVYLYSPRYTRPRQNTGGLNARSRNNNHISSP